MCRRAKVAFTGSNIILKSTYASVAAGEILAGTAFGVLSNAVPAKNDQALELCLACILGASSFRQFQDFKENSTGLEIGEAAVAVEAVTLSGLNDLNVGVVQVFQRLLQ